MFDLPAIHVSNLHAHAVEESCALCYRLCSRLAALRRNVVVAVSVFNLLLCNIVQMQINTCANGVSTAAT